MSDSDIHRYSRVGNLDGLNELLLGGGDVNESGYYGHTPLYEASIHGHLEIVNVLLAAGAEVNKTGNDGTTPLHSASRNGHLDIVISLIRAKADVRIMNNNGESPLDVADTYEIRQYIHEYHPWQRRRPLILTRPHDDHATNGDHKLSALGDIVTATTSDNVELFDIKRIIVSFL